MKNTIKVILLVASSLALVTAIIASCVTLNENIKYTFTKQRNSVPVDAFVLVSVDQKTVPVSCETKEQSIDCKKLLKSLPPLIKGWTGSGLLVESDVGPSILTAAHVCTKDTINELDYKGVKIEMSTETHIKILSPLKGSYTSKVIRVDIENDLCLLKPSKIFTNPIAISKTPPEIGDKVYAIAAPFGIFGRGMSLIFTGHYSGNQNGKSFYTIPTRPGSSGSSVLNKNWEVIGVIHTAFVHFESVGVGTDFFDVRNFLFPTK
jgi:S1-C subfamily serine protease